MSLKPEHKNKLFNDDVFNVLAQINDNSLDMVYGGS